jgi:transcriptional regulator with XRE-family HTH domain
VSKLQTIRKAAALSQSALAEKSGVSVRMIQFYEQGVKDINKAQAITLLNIARVLNVSIEDIMEKVSADNE